LPENLGTARLPGKPGGGRLPGNLGFGTELGYARRCHGRLPPGLTCSGYAANGPLTCKYYLLFTLGLLTVRDMAHVGYL
jgi:hypothetical protein